MTWTNDYQFQTVMEPMKEQPLMKQQELYTEVPMTQKPEPVMKPAYMELSEPLVTQETPQRQNETLMKQEINVAKDIERERRRADAMDPLLSPMGGMPGPTLPQVGDHRGPIDAPPRGLGCRGTHGHPWPDIY